MDNKIRHLDDSSTTDTLLTLPRSDFPKPKTDTSTLLHNVEPPPQEEDRLLLVRLPSSKSGGVTMSDLTQGQTVYMLGDTSESDIDHSNRANGQIGHDDGEFDEGNNIHVPIPTRLIIEGKSEEEKGKTLELMRVETSNTYILVPPMPDGGDVTNGSPEGAMEDDIISNKRQKIDGDNTTKKLTTMPARSVGLIPGEESPACFFLEPVHLKQGHFASKLRWALSRWVYDPLDPPRDAKFGYSLNDLAHICRTSESEIGHALSNRSFGADDALVIPSGGETEDEKLYGILSEEGRQTVSMAILSALLESDVDLAWHFSKENKAPHGMDLSLIVKDVRTNWHYLEENGMTSSSQESQNDAPMLTDSKHEAQSESQSQFFTPAEFNKLKHLSNEKASLSDEIIWHCLRPMVCYTDSGHKDNMPKTVWFLPDEVAKLAAHNVFLRSSKPDGWEENEFIEAWNMRMPSISKYELSLGFLSGIALSDLKAGESGKIHTMWQYFPEATLSLTPSLRIKSMFAMCSEWTLHDAIPYLSKFVCASEDVDVESEIKGLLEKFAKATNSAKTTGIGAESMTTKYVLSTN